MGLLLLCMFCLFVLTNSFTEREEPIQRGLRKSELQNGLVASLNGLLQNGKGHKSTNKSNQKLTFRGYVSSAYEQEWIENVQNWQADVCSHTNETVIKGWISAVRALRRLDSKKLKRYLRSPEAFPVISKYLSHYEYSSGDKSAFVPIEPFIGLCRDPRKCLDVNSENYTQSKAYLVPLNHVFLRQVVGKREFGQEGKKTFLFDAGATYYSDTARQGTKWIVDFYASQGINISHVIAWEAEPVPKELHTKGVPDELLPNFVYNNFPIDAKIGSTRNPLTVIKKMCRKEDFVVFKLDIDVDKLENEIVKQMAGDPAILSLVDEFYYEFHFSNAAMAMHQWGGYRSKLSDYYRFAVALRKKGFRIHYWP